MGKPTLIVAAGHGGADKGNVSTEHCERDCCQIFVESMHAWAKQMRIPLGIGGLVIVPHHLDLAGEVDYITNTLGANSADGDWAVDIHLDYKPRGGRGCMAIVDETMIAIEGAKQFLTDWSRRTGIPNHGVVNSKVWAETARRWGPGSDMGFCRPKAWGGSILELGCLNSAEDMRQIQTAIAPQYAIDFLWNAWLRVRDARS